MYIKRSPKKIREERVLAVEKYIYEMKDNEPLIQEISRELAIPTKSLIDILTKEFDYLEIYYSKHKTCRRIRFKKV